ncbi:NAD(P)/FAD-dependent oxidoreductase [Sporofaciens musculi]|jgi:predicted Rossmann fold flavoprotein|uniref:NAD(P)/FAD-dependent oxidoreductase n=1 Tax=Sporofaciens musculi TaxID=2681861 RepID=UPI0025870662|nr:NAD(P)/FAD-dependent oxidoreductase [Sporofaciens musculi]
MRRIGIIGGGASGIAAAITAARNDRKAQVFILEQKEKIGRKLLATGNGRCNLTNRLAVPSCANVCYRGGNIQFVEEVLRAFSYEDTLKFFESVGLVVKLRGDYVYPRSDQASAVLELLELELKRLGVEVYCNVKVASIAWEGKNFCIRTEETCSAKSFKADRLILASGGQAASSLGSDGSGYGLAKALKHSVTCIVPALVQLKVKAHPFAKASGVRTEAKVTALIDGKEAASDTGEVQITAYGISGIPVFQISRFIALGLHQKKRSEVLLDLLPEYSEDEVYRLLVKMGDKRDDLTAKGWLTGIFNQKLVPRILEMAGVRIQTRVSELRKSQLQAVAKKCKRIILPIQDTNGFENAQVCAGGVRTKEVCPRTMESLRTKGVYITGELLDVDGICGGFNLQWAWATGCIAGKASVMRKKK